MSSARAVCPLNPVLDLQFLPPLIFETRLSTQSGCCPVGFRDPLTPVPLVLSLQAPTPRLTFSVGSGTSELRFSCMCGKHLLTDPSSQPRQSAQPYNLLRAMAAIRNIEIHS